VNFLLQYIAPNYVVGSISISPYAEAEQTIDSLRSELVTDTASVILFPEDFDFVQQVKQHDFPDNVECTFDESKFSLALKGPMNVL
jgi:hypothetical protein